MELRTDHYKLKDVFPERAKKYAQKLHIKADEIEFVRKAIPIDPPDIKIEEGERAAIRLVTTPRLDRDQEILIPDGAMLDDFRQSPSVLFGHDYRSLPIGKDIWIKPTKKGILAKTAYAMHQFAEDVYQCVKGGFLNSNSVGFIPVEEVYPSDGQFKTLVEMLEKDYGVPKDESNQARKIYTKWILLEHSDVPVASNAQSLNLAVGKGELVIESESLRKDLGVEDKVRAHGFDKEIIQGLNDGQKIIQETRDEAQKLGLEIVEPPAAHGCAENTTAIITTNATTWTQIEGPVDTGPIYEFPQHVVHKPETTEDYHRIPIDEGNHDGHKIRTMTISADEGIKSLYCVDCKKIITYLFSTDKWTMEEARTWVNEHKEERDVAAFGLGADISAHEYWLMDLEERLTNLKAGHDITVKALEGVTEGVFELESKISDLAAKPSPALPPAPVAVPTPAPEPKPESTEVIFHRVLQRMYDSGQLKAIIQDAIQIAIAKLRGRVI